MVQESVKIMLENPQKSTKELFLFVLCVHKLLEKNVKSKHFTLHSIVSVCIFIAQILISVQKILLFMSQIYFNVPLAMNILLCQAFEL